MLDVFICKGQWERLLERLTKMDRRSFLKHMVWAFLVLIGFSSGTFYYSREIETQTLEIRKESLSSNKIPTTFHNKKIIQFSDTHLGFHFSSKDFKKLAAEINKRKPDIIVFTGDLIDDPKQLQDGNLVPIIDALRALEAPLGKYWIYGNHDHGGYGTEIVLDIMEKGGFTLLQNNHVEINEQNGSIIIAGIDDLMLGKPDIRTALADADPDLFTILLAHEPDFADETVNYPVDVQLSGHSHGGQVRFPIIGHLYTPLYAEKYVLGKYILRDKLELFVNAGIGTTRVPYRLFCKPEIHEYTLKTKMS